MSVKRKARPSRFAAGNRFDQKTFALLLSEDEMGGIRRHGRQPGRINVDAGAAARKRSQFRQAARMDCVSKTGAGGHRKLVSKGV